MKRSKMFNIKITDRILVYILFVVLAVLSAVTIVGNRDARNAAIAAAVAAKEAKESTVQREYIVNVQKVTGVCTLLTSGAVNTEEIPYEAEAILAHHNACIDKYSQPPPPPLPALHNPPS